MLIAHNSIFKILVNFFISFHHEAKKFYLSKEDYLCYIVTVIIELTSKHDKGTIVTDLRSERDLIWA